MRSLINSILSFLTKLATREPYFAEHRPHLHSLNTTLRTQTGTTSNYTVFKRFNTQEHTNMYYYMSWFIFSSLSICFGNAKTKTQSTFFGGVA